MTREVSVSKRANFLRVNLAIIVMLALLPQLCRSGDCGHVSMLRSRGRSASQQESKALVAARDPKLGVDEFLEDFRRLPPQDRVQLWEDSNNFSKRNTPAYRADLQVHDLLVIEGTDAAPWLSRIVRDPRKHSFTRLWALLLLAQMQEYVPREKFPKGAQVIIRVEEFDLRGALNPFVAATGERIGAEGREAFLWAAAQSDDRDLRFQARLHLGLVEQELRTLPLPDQIRRWRDLVAKTRGGVGSNDSLLREMLGRSIVERAPESIEPLLKILSDDHNSHVLEFTVDLFDLIDTRRVRLRGSEIGRTAIDAIRQVLLSGRIKPHFRGCETPEKRWLNLSEQFYKDNFWSNPGSQGEFYAEMLHAIYGENTIFVSPGDPVKLEHARPDFGQFFTFLTERDPYFPSWEYIYFARGYAQVFHPKFELKMSRIEAAWREFQESNRKPAETKK